MCFDFLKSDIIEQPSIPDAQRISWDTGFSVLKSGKTACLFSLDWYNTFFFFFNLNNTLEFLEFYKNASLRYKERKVTHFCLKDWHFYVSFLSQDDDDYLFIIVVRVHGTYKHLKDKAPVRFPI